MSISIPKTDLPQSDRVRVTLCFKTFSEDGEVATVTDSSGVCADIPLSSLLWEQHRDLIAGDTAACDMLREVWVESGLVPDENPAEAEETAGQELSEASLEDTPPPDDVPEDTGAPTEQAPPDPAPPVSAGVHDVHRKGRDIIEVVLPLTNSERLELADEMAQALAERDSLEAEFNLIKKDYKTRIDMQVSVAAQAGETYREGERTQTVSCDLFEDRTTCELIWLDSVSGLEIKRRGMTFEERQLKLPGLDVPKQERRKKIGKKADTPASALDQHTCLNCGHRDATTDAMPEPCHTCSQIESGDADNWMPIHECATCTHKTTRVHMPPCNACRLNADEAHRGKKDAWEWGQQNTSVAPDTTSPDAPLATLNADTVLPDVSDMPCVNKGPDELDNIPADCIPESVIPEDDAMPALPPIGDGNRAGRSGMEVRQ